MGIFYDPAARKWQISYDKVDYQTDYPTNLITNAPTNLQTNLPINLTRQEPAERLVNKPVQVYKSTYNFCNTTDNQGNCQGGYTYSYVTEYQNVWEPYLKTVDDAASNLANNQKNINNAALNAQNEKANKKIENKNTFVFF